MVINSIFHRWSVRRRGRHDGKDNRPPSDAAKPIGFELTLHHRGNDFIRQLSSPRVTKKKNGLEARAGDLQNRLSHAREEYARIKKRYEDKGRDPIVPFPPLARWLVLTLVFIAEVPFNVAVFRTVGEAEWITWIMGIGVAIAVPLAAHVIGLQVRQSKSGPWWTIFRALLLSGVLASFLFGLNYVRIEYLAEIPAEDRLIQDPKTLELAYYAINLLLYFVGMLVSFFSHDEDAEIEDMKRKADRLRREEESLHAQLQSAHNGLEALKEELDARAGQITAIMTELVHIYRHSNQAKRSDPAPKYFGEDPVFDKLPWAAQETTERSGLFVPADRPTKPLS